MSIRDSNIEELERPRRGKIVPPESLQSAGRRKGPARVGVKKTSANAAKRSVKKVDDENTPTQAHGSLKLRLSSKLVDFDAEGTFSFHHLRFVGSY